MTALAAIPPSTLSAEPSALRTVVVRGATAYSSAELFAAYRDELGKPITPASAQAIAGALVRRYRDDGFARPVLRVGDALSAQGILAFEIFEPRIVRVTIEGDPGNYRGAIEQRAGAVLESLPLRRDAIARALAEMRRLRGLEVTATTRRVAGLANSHELVLEADYSPVAGMVRMNNRGTEEIGPAFALGEVAANDLLGRGEKIGLAFAGAGDPREYLSGALFVDAPIGAGASRGFAMLFRSRSDPHEAPDDLDAHYTRERARFRLTRALREASGHQVELSAGFEAENLTIDLEGERVRDDRLRVVEGGVRASWRAGDFARFSSALKMRMGLDALGAGLRAFDRAVDLRRGDFLLTQLQASGYTRLGESWSLRCDAFAQQSAYVLPYGERFKIGGERLGRGFEVAEIAGDEGLGAKLTLRRELPALAGAWGRPSAYGIYDIAAAWKQDEPGRESAATAGVGLALGGARFSGYVELVKPLTHADVEGKRGAAVFAELRLRF